MDIPYSRYGIKIPGHSGPAKKQESFLLYSGFLTGFGRGEIVFSFFNSGKNKAIDQYWADLEKEVDDKVQDKFLSYYHSGYMDIPGPVQGLIITGDKGIYYRTFRKTSGLLKYITAVQDNNYKKLVINIPWNSIDTLYMPVRKSWFFTSSEQNITLTFKGNQPEMKFSILQVKKDDVERFRIIIALYLD
jgi:hypothetical protein